jgi:hypothetical protein
MIYLYVKTHRTTGMKYLGKTSAENPHKYPGSGKYWKRHVKEHGNNVDTQIIKECENINDVREWGIYYSELWDVVNSKEWANLCVESGDGGARIGASERMRKMRLGKKPWNKGRPMTSIEKDQQRRSHLGKITSPITKEKQRIGNLGKKMSKTTKEKLRVAHTGKILSTEHREKIRLARANQTLKPVTLETREKMRESALNRPIITCPKCGTTGTGGGMARWHFSQCKTKSPQASI